MGRMLQWVGLTVLPLAMYMEVTKMLGRTFGVSHMVFMMIFGIAAFSVGRIVEGYAARA